MYFQNKLLNSLIIGISLVLPLHAYADTSIADIVDEIAVNNLKLASISASNAGLDIEYRSENILPPLEIEYSPFFRSHQTGVASSELIVKQSFEFPTLYHSRSKAALHQMDILDKSLKKERMAIMTEARKKCQEYIYYSSLRRILDKKLAVEDSLVHAISMRYELGEATILDLNKSKLEYSEIQREISENHLMQLSIKQDLVAMNAGKQLNLEDLNYDISASTFVLPEDISAFISRSPEIAEAEAEMKFAEINLSISRQGWLPALSIGYRRNTELNDALNGFLIGAEFPIYSARKKIKGAEAGLTNSRLNYENVKIEEETRINGVLDRLRYLQQIIRSYDDSLINETLSLYARSLQLNQISLTDYFTETSFLYDHLITKAGLEFEFQTLLSSLLRERV